jgi:hypothetical protein
LRLVCEIVTIGHDLYFNALTEIFTSVYALPRALSHLAISPLQPVIEPA